MANRIVFRLALLFATVFAVSNLAQHGLAEDWPRWRGVQFDDISRETGLLKEWPEGGPARTWLNENVGLGYAGVSISSGKLFTMGLLDDNQEYVICLNEADGKELWKTAIGERLENGWGDGPRSTPTVDGGFVFALGGKGELACLDVSSGEIKWSKSAKSLEGGVPGWGYCESVLVDGKQVVFTPGGKQGAIAALNRESGELLWQSSDVKYGAQYASLVPVQLNGQRQYLQFFQEALVSVSAENGAMMWEAPFAGKTAVILTPIAKDNFFYVTAGYGAGCLMVEVDGDNKVSTIYENKEMKNHHGGVVLVDGYLYGYSDGPGWMCQNFKTGEVVWSNKEALGKGCVTCADGMLYCVDEKTGDVVLAKATPEKWEEHGRFKLEPQTQKRNPKGRIWTHPVVCNGKLYLRDQELLSAYSLKP